MQQFSIPFLLLKDDSLRIEQASLALDKEEKHPVKVAPWPAFTYRPDVAFSIAHDGDNIFLKYYVEEDSVTAVHRETNGPVYKDSCVEFFIAFGDDKEYYNIEFNCAGTCHMGFGNEKEGRLQIPNEQVEKIIHQTSFKTGGQSQAHSIKWELSLIIPIGIFHFHQPGSLENKSCRINFYKCGDELPQPHYLSWTDMSSDAPNFHLPQFFREAHFAGNAMNGLIIKEMHIEDNL